MNACPTPQDLQALLSDVADHPSVHALNAHLAVCPRCCALLDQLADDPELCDWRSADRSTPKECETGPGLDDLLRLPLTVAKERPVDSALTFLTPPLRPGDLGCLGPYRIEAELGRGGMGIVLRGHDEGLHRHVAIKVLRPELAQDAARSRFVREARAAAQVRHDHVVTIFSVANPDDGLPYFTMELLGGQSLSDRIGRHGLAPEQAADCVAQAAEGLAAAHAAGLIHRDVKPANLLVDPASGRIKVSDFGLVYDTAVRTSENRTTQQGVVLGTPAYMSPEQAVGGNIDFRTDVYGLGMTLYEALTGEVPFRGAMHLVLRQIANDDPKPPRQLKEVPRDLETICLKAMAKEPERRYASAALLADDLRRWQRGEPIQARPAGPWERGWRWCRRNRRVAGLSLALVFALVAGLAGTSWQAWQASENAERADADRVLAERRGNEADAASKLADQRRDEAEEGLRAAIAAVDDLLTGVSEEQLLHQPQLQPLRRKLLTQALAHYQRFLKTHGDNPRLVREVALAAHRLAMLLDQIGSTDDADSAYAEAITRLDQAITHAPADLGLRTKRAQCHMHLGLAYQRRGNLKAAIASFEVAARMCKEIVDADPKNRSLQGNLLACCGNLANLHSLHGEPSRALTWYDVIQASLAEMLRDDPENPALQRTHGLNMHNQAMTFSNLQQYSKALESYERAHEIRRRLVERFPDSGFYLRDLARTQEMLAALHHRNGAVATALGHYQSAVATLEKVVNTHPSVKEYRENLVQAYLNLAGFLADQKEYEPSLSAYKKGRTLSRATLKADGDARARAYLVRNLYSSAALQMHRGQSAEAYPLLQEAVELEMESLKLSDPGAQRHTDLAAIARERRQRWPNDPVMLYACACDFARCAELVGRDQGEVSDDARQQRDAYAEQAVEVLREAARLGINEPKLLAVFSDLAALRDRADFKKLQAEFAAKLLSK